MDWHHPVIAQLSISWPNAEAQEKEENKIIALVG